jgi:tetratricopeptide (TPR) repeat protein
MIGKSAGHIFQACARRKAVAVVICACLGLVCVACVALSFLTRPRSRMQYRDEPLLSGIGPYHRDISTDSVHAQNLFDQGLAFLYGFDRGEAIRSFEGAAAADPGCAMAYWGIALAQGPDLNQYAPPNAASINAARAAISTAMALANRASPAERALISALSTKYPQSAPADQKSVGEAYANAMRDIRKNFPEDPDIGALTAESIMEMRAWKWWKSDGAPATGTNEAISLLNDVISRTPQHPFALHLLVHLVEGSSHPEIADVAADRLRHLTPGVPHLLHMPSHIDVRRGRWQQAVLANESAIAVERRNRALVRRRGEYRIGQAHNHHMLVFAAMMQGQSRKALDITREMLNEIPERYRRRHSQEVDGFFAMQYEVDLRFGRWDTVIAAAPPDPALRMATAFLHYARGVAYAATKQLQAAKAEQQAFNEARDEIPQDAGFRRQSVDDLLDIAERILEGEILYREGHTDLALAALREGVRCEDELGYSEPPYWMFPSRHVLGATLFDCKHIAEAEAVYRADLTRYPGNGWSLFGLMRCLLEEGKPAEARLVSAQLKESWQYADIVLHSSCCCLNQDVTR